MPGRSRHTPAERSQLLEAWSASGLSAAAFASSCGVSTHTLYSWRRAARSRSAVVPAARESATATFAEVRLRRSAATAATMVTGQVGVDDGEGEPVEIRMGDVTIAVGGAFDDDVLARIIRVVREAS